MRSLGLVGSLSGATILCLGAHSDDIEIGCAGTLRRIIDENQDLSFQWVVLSATGARETEARASSAEILSDVERKEIVIQRFRNGFFPYLPELKDFFESLKRLRRVDLILTHCRHDLHQDHRTVAELTWNTFRDHLILEYEIPKYDADLASPNVFTVLTEEQVDQKYRLLERHFASQRSKQWFSVETFRGLCRLRGVECNSPTGYAEAFYARKLTLG